MQKTANQIKSSFETLASGHYQIHSFLYAQEFEQQAYENLIYPLMLVYPLGGSLSGTTYSRNYRVIIADRVLKSEGNELEVESDTQLIALDVLAYWMKLGQNERFAITSSNTITPFWEKWGDEVTGHFVDIGIEEFYDFNSCAIPLSGSIPTPPNPCKDARISVNSVVYGNAPSDSNFNVVVKDQLGSLVGSLIGGEWIVNTGGSCADATYTIEDTLGNILYTGSIVSGGSLTQAIGNSTLNVNNSAGTLISSESILAEGTDSYNVADSVAVIKNSAGTTLKSENILATASENITINDSLAVIKDSANNTILFEDILAEGSKDIVINDSLAVIKDSANLTLKTENILAEATENIVINDSLVNVRKSDNVLISAVSVKAENTENYLVADSNVTNSNSSYDVDVKATDSLILPDQQINVNSVDEGDIPSVGTIDIDLSDGVNPVTPTSVTITGRTIDIVVPSGVPPSTGDYLVRFFDIDGTILKEEYVNTGNDATAPTTPDIDPTYLTFAEWNQGFTNVQNDIDVGAIYDTIDGKTYLFLRITDTTGLQPTLQLNKSTTSLLTIDWGDSTTNTSTTTGNQNITKTAAYASIGDYVVTIEDSGLHGNTTASFILGNNLTYSRTLLKAYLGTNFRLYRGTFNACASLEIVSLVKNTALDDRDHFINCFSLKHVNIPALSGVTSMLNFSNCYSLKTISFPPQFTTLQTVFGTCNALTSINLTGVNTISGNSVFASCTSLRKLNLPNVITSLTLGLVSDCFSLKEILIPSSLTTLNNSVFSNNRNLTQLEFGSALTTIGTNVFANCNSILEYTFLSTTPPTLANINAFTGINAACKIYVPDANVSAYKSASNWVTYANYIYPLSTKP